jgi:hypothetical protein
VTVAETTATVLELVAEERDRQREKWGAQHHCEVEWTTILAEEVGEAAKEALTIHFGSPRPVAFPHETRERWLASPYVAELIQTAAVAVAAIENVLYGSA